MRTEPRVTAEQKRSLEQIRQRNDWTYRELAALVGMTLPTLQRVLGTDAQPNARNAYKLQRFLELHARRRRTA